MTLSFLSLTKNAEAAETIAKKITEKHNLSASLVRILEGSQLVFLLNDSLVLKIFNPDDELFFQNEVLFLQQLFGKLPIKTPKLILSDYEENLSYLIMQKLEGVPLNKVWETISYAQKSELLYQLGTIVKEYHHLPKNRFTNTTHPWSPFIRDQKENLVKNHTNFGVNMELIDQIIKWVNIHSPDLSNSEDIVPLHTELMLEHIFVEQTGDKWSITGLIDFEPAMLGHREYDFAAVGVFICPGDPHLFRQFMLGYGYKPEKLTPSFSRRIMSWLLLHRYCNLTWFCKSVPEYIPSNNLESLHDYWFTIKSNNL